MIFEIITVTPKKKLNYNSLNSSESLIDYRMVLFALRND